MIHFLCLKRIHADLTSVYTSTCVPTYRRYLDSYAMLRETLSQREKFAYALRLIVNGNER